MPILFIINLSQQNKRSLAYEHIGSNENPQELR